MVVQRIKSHYGLENHGLINVRKEHWNHNTPMLYEDILKGGEGHVVHLGPIVTRTGDDGSFEVPELPTGPWRLETRIVGFLPVRVGMDFRQDTQLSVSMVAQPAGYDPSPLELMPLEEPIPPKRFRSPGPTPAPDEAEEEETPAGAG